MYPPNQTKSMLVRPRSSLSSAPDEQGIRPNCTKSFTNLERTLCGLCFILFVLCIVLLGALILIGKSLAYNNHFFNNKLNKYVDNSVITNRDSIDGSEVVKLKPKIIFKVTQEDFYHIKQNSAGESPHSKNNLEHNKKGEMSKAADSSAGRNIFSSENKNNIAMSKIINKLSFRLPREIRPKHYELYLHPNLQKKTFSGNVTILLNVLKPINFIPVHSKLLNITATSVFKIAKDGLSNEVEHSNTFEHKIHEYWVTEFDKELDIGDYLLKLAFNGSLTNRIVGFYQSSYFDPNTNETRMIATSKFEPTYARQAFPCFDEPAMKATFKITLVRPTENGYHALSNMNVLKEIPNGDTTQVVFNESVKMSTYLACFIVSDFDSKGDVIETGGVGENFDMRVYATPAQLNKVKFALETGKKITEYYIGYFKIPYPLPKLDMAAIPDFVSGAMEHWGLVTFRETSLLYDKAISSTSNKQRVGDVIAHELAHMWFGNLVTMQWWNDLWLNEGFASYIEYKGLNNAYPEWKRLDQFLVDDLHGVMKLDATLASHPIVQTVESPDQITELFDTITYKKGASVIRMLEDFVGPKNFQLAVSNYLKKFAYGNAVTDDLLNEIDAIGLDFDVKLIMQTWTEQMGLPVVEVTKISETEYKLKQKRFLSNPEDEKKHLDDSPFKWQIPITYFTSENSTVTRQWFKHSDAEDIIRLQKPVNWIKFNKDQIGYYRVNYPAELWKELTNALINKPDDFSIPDRAHLLNDIFALADATQLPYDIALDLTRYLKEEKDYVPWNVALSKLSSLQSMLFYSSTYKNFLSYGRKLVNDVYTRVGWQPNENHLENLLRVTILDAACALGLEDGLNEAGNRFNKWLEEPEKRPEPDIRSVIYYYGMKKAGNEQNWETVWNLFKAEQDANEKLKLMKGLAGIEVPWILKKFIDLAWDENNVRSQDYFSCLTYIAANRVGETIVWDYVRENWQKLVDRFGLNERYLGSMIPSVTGRFSSKTKLKEMESFFKEYPEAGAGTAARKRALENVKNNVKWLEENEEKVAEWLRKQ